MVKSKDACLSDFIKAILAETPDKHGDVYLMMGNSIAECYPKLQYANGKVTKNADLIPAYDNMKIASVESHGGMYCMDYEIKFAVHANDEISFDIDMLITGLKNYERAVAAHIKNLK